MHFALTLFFFSIANIGIYIYSIASKTSELTGWKVFLLPLIFFPRLFFINSSFSTAWMISKKTTLSVGVIGIINIASYILIFLLGDIFYLKQSLSIQMLVGIFFVLLGIIIMTLK